jgi:hypothetical protein
MSEETAEELLELWCNWLSRHRACESESPRCTTHQYAHISKGLIAIHERTKSLVYPGYCRLEVHHENNAAKHDTINGIFRDYRRESLIARTGVKVRRCDLNMICEKLNEVRLSYVVFHDCENTDDDS